MRTHGLHAVPCHEHERFSEESCCERYIQQLAVSVLKYLPPHALNVFVAERSEATRQNESDKTIKKNPGYFYEK